MGMRTAASAGQQRRRPAAPFSYVKFSAAEALNYEGGYYVQQD